MQHLEFCFYSRIQAGGFMWQAPVKEAGDPREAERSMLACYVELGSEAGSTGLIAGQARAHAVVGCIS
ncbi:hypothetical protein DA83_04850 [Pseudomonas sp. 250J]|nr:hypothetical protein DA83_04850 [Pseudomonas sp. 250J]